MTKSTDQMKEQWLHGQAEAVALADDGMEPVARMMKAIKLAHGFTRLARGVEPDLSPREVADLAGRQWVDWSTVAGLIGTRPPSERTVALTRRCLEVIADEDGRVAYDDADEVDPGHLEAADYDHLREPNR